MKIHSVRIIAIAAAVVATGAALAINISSTAVSPIYASELIYSSTAPIASQVGSSVLGFGVSAGQQRFVRFDVTNATFAESVSNANTPQTPPAASFANSQWVSGGATGTSSAIFQVTANAAGQSPTDVASFIIPKLAVTSNGSPVTATFQLYETAAAAVANAGPLFTATGTLARFASGLAVTMTSSTARTTVATGYTKWATAAASGPSNTGALGTVKIGVPSNSVPVGRDGATSIALTDFLSGTGSTLTVTGDFTAAGASGVYLGNTASCQPLSPVANFTLDTAKTTASLTIPGFASSQPWGSAANLCYQVSGTAVIPASSYTATASVGFLSIASGVSGTQVAGASIGAVTRDGTTLQAPFVQVPSGWLVRFVLTNTGSTAAAYTGAVTAGPSNVTGGTANAVATNGTLTGTIPAGGQAIIEGSSLPTFTTSARGFAVFTVSGTNDTINGVYQIVNATTGSISNMEMVRPVSAYGPN